MMALGDILAARADNARARGTVEAGALGTVEVEALPVRELERLARGADGDRAVFYAACRALQSAGAALLREGKVYRPDQVMALVSDAEAAKAAEAVRALSGWLGTETDGKAAEVLPAERTDGDSARAGEAVDTGGFYGTAEMFGQGDALTTPQTEDGQASREAEIRPAVVQENAEVRRDAVQKKTADALSRPDTVRKNATAFEEIRRSSVQNEIDAGKVPHEFLTGNSEGHSSDGETQILPEKSPDGSQNVAASGKMSDKLRNAEQNLFAENATPKDKKESDLREGEPETDGQGGENLYEFKSEIAAQSGNSLYEIGSESVKMLHERKPDFDTRRGGELHESESEITETVHETTSELAERVVRELLEGLRRAAWVR